MRIVVLGGGFAGMEAVRVLERPRDTAMMRRAPRCVRCAHLPAGAREPEAAA